MTYQFWIDALLLFNTMIFDIQTFYSQSKDTYYAAKFEVGKTAMILYIVTQDMIYKYASRMVIKNYYRAKIFAV